MTTDRGVSDALLAEVRALAGQVQNLTDELQNVMRRLLSDKDRRDLGRLLPLVHALLGGEVWDATSLYAAAQTAVGAPELSALMSEWNTPSGGLRSFGKFLERCSGCTAHDLRLVALGRGRGGALYMVQVSGRAKPSQLVAGMPSDSKTVSTTT